ncbi:hypothetical protein ABFS82_06G024000 [Erythranthe guttata]|uniref:BHLH domain-containing protein n=1 Tax=Erythranthe guttata TaxID=4155 RepID=A0A022QB46_ERYGU|nr:PREDICTED: transcription factor SPEECHLESS-like [Erythranthe guttata]EYU25196.1 hypothetical protein MIMGU_mgv1a018456mg [Erythranthe guttata]|eukprot:XP_012852033.1 PREDICTED: transcription factor SPEECHLESS-like [Erythranthe guttata]
MAGSDNSIAEFFEETHEFCGDAANSIPDDIFSILEALESASDCIHLNNNQTTLNDDDDDDAAFEFHKSSLIRAFQPDSPHSNKRQKLNMNNASASASASASEQPRITHITVERNRRKQMNEHLSVLRSLMPCFYVKRGDQASIIGGVINYINELQQVLQSLEAKKQRKSFSDILTSPRPMSSPRKPPLSPRVGPPISPRTPQSSSPYKPMMLQINNLHQTTGFNLNSPSSLPSPVETMLSPCNSSTTNSSINDSINELVASSKSAAAEVEVKFCGPNLLLKTVSNRIRPGQLVKIVSALEQLALEILQVNINRVDERMLNSFTIKIGIECQLSAEELAEQIQQTFC